MKSTLIVRVPRSKGDDVRRMIHKHWLEQVEFDVRRVWYFWREFTITGPEDSVATLRTELNALLRR